MPTIVLSPVNVADFPDGGGHFWVYMHYALGLARSGCEVYWLERFRGRGDEERDQATIAGFLERMAGFGLRGKVVLYRTGMRRWQDVGPPAAYLGWSRAEAEDLFARADLLLNFHYDVSPELLGRFRRTALVDIDPGLLQFWIDRRQIAVASHDLYFTIGETVGTPAARFPDCGIDWIRTRPPVYLEAWPAAPDASAGAFTSVSNWSAKNWIVNGDEIYENTKRVAFLELAGLPALTSQPLELALCLRTEADHEEGRALRRRGWSVRDAAEVAGTPDGYRRYIQASRGEIGCAKPAYVRFRNAWISDRTLCYLASGKPAVVQDTGVSRYLPDGEGVLRFSTPEGAAAAIEAVNADYEGHARSARRLAETWFDATRVLPEVLSRALG